MVEIDRTFIQPDEYKPNHVVTEGGGIPVIDLSPITNPDSSSLDHPNALANLATEIGDACKKWGFFTVINHGVALDTRQKIFTVAKKFFTLPQEEKKKVKRSLENTMGYHDTEHSNDFRDWKEVYDFYAKDGTFLPASLEPDDQDVIQFFNQWPQNFPEFRETCEEYVEAVQKLLFNLLELICLSLGLPAKRLHGYFNSQSSVGRLSYYPPCPSPDLVLGTGGHKDPTVLTLLAQDNVGGLDVQRKTDGAWVPVKPIPDSYVVNVGDLLQVWSNDLYESAEHRVRVNAELERYSIALFYQPSHTTMMKPLEELVNEQNPAKFREYNSGKWIRWRMFNNYQKHGFYKRIADYKISV